MSDQSQKSLQDQFLDNLLINNPQVSVYLRHGIRLKGKLVAHGPTTIYIHDGSTVQQLYKTWISTIQPETFYMNYE